MDYTNIGLEVQKIVNTKNKCDRKPIARKLMDELSKDGMEDITKQRQDKNNIDYLKESLRKLNEENRMLTNNNNELEAMNEGLQEELGRQDFTINDFSRELSQAASHINDLRTAINKIPNA